MSQINTTPDLPVIFILGPTASGKTAVACELSKRLDCELISVDSSQVYRRMNIGTAKPSMTELQRYPHHLIDVREPWQTYSAADFRDDALRLVASAHAVGKVPVLVGGTMLYFKAFAEGIAAMPAADEQVRGQITALAAESGWQVVHERLNQVDPASAARIHPNDPQRLQRALEVFMVTGQPISQLQQSATDNGYAGRILKFGLYPQNRALLHQRINERFDAMLQKGLLQEVEQLSAEPDIHLDLPSQRAVGYRQAWQHLAGELSQQEFVDSGQASTRQLAKRQLTWMRGMQLPELFDSENLGPEQMATKILASITGIGKPD